MGYYTSLWAAFPYMSQGDMPYGHSVLDVGYLKVPQFQNSTALLAS